MTDLLPRLPAGVQDEFNKLFLGERLGAGADREVYAHALDPRLVIKLELMDSQRFQNVHEWDVWHEVRDTKWACWFAPCRYISHSGSVLIMDRTMPIDQLPKELPAFFTDLKPRNFGRIGRRIVAHDYGLTLLRSRGLGGVRMRPTKGR